MVILGLERPVEYGSRQIFDPTMANMVLNALNNYIQAMKEDYLRGREDLKEFNKNFGDFFSPILKDMEWYDQNVTGATRDLINNLYAQGMDMRNPEFRAAVSRFINNMPVGKINQLKQSAADANEYLKNKAILQSKGLWNPEFEKMVLGGRSLEDWDTNKYGMWTRTSPAEYKDLNLFTTHIFDALKDSYIGTDKDHYDWYGITPELMMQSLTPDTIGGLLNSDLGRFHYNNARNDLLRQGIANPTDAQIMQQFKDNIVAANNEKTHRDRRINELWKMLQEHNSRMSAARVSAGGNNNTPSNSIIGFTDRIKDAVRQQQLGKTTGASNLRSKIKITPVNGQSLASALRTWATKTTTPQGFDQEEGAKLLFYGYTEKSQEAVDVLKGRKAVRFTFVPGAGLHYTPVRVWDHNGVSVRGSSKMFDDYLHKHHVYGYPVEEPITMTYDAQGNSHIFDANGFIQISADQIEGYFKERYYAKTESDDYNSDEYKEYKKKQMNQLGLVENMQETSKQYVESDDHKGVYLPEYTTYYTMPVSRVTRITGLGLSAIDTRVDKSVVTGNELGGRERAYQNRDYNRRNK